MVTRPTSNLDRYEPKHVALRRILQEHIGASQPGDMLPSYAGLIRQYGVGQTTIDRVWRELDATGLIVRRHGKGVFVSPRAKQKNIGLVFGLNVFAAGASPIYSMLLQRCQQRAETHNEHFSFYIDASTRQKIGGESPPAQRDLVEAIKSGKLHGILLASRHSVEQENWLRRQNIPVVAFAAEMRAPGIVGIDCGELVRLGVEALAAQGCRRIALMTALSHARLHVPPFDEDTRAYEETLRRLGLEFRPQWIWEDRGVALIGVKGSATWREEGQRGVRELFGGVPDAIPDGVMITDDIMTEGALLAAQKMGLTVGRDVKIACHANKGSAVLHGYEDILTLVEVDPDEIVEAMFGMLEARIGGKKSSEEMILVKPKVHAGSQHSKRKE